ncbi:DMT family transporter [Convivina intestini]|uniref:DMT family transporter n=1 Tax=Convivina intestini TaxID=1505726 RepID=UPI00200D15DC|nr:DMT family transporter [Convivina intestini]CAH1850972.1 putative amino-acid metabolite efflux pump [Convivina intestini]
MKTKNILGPLLLSLAASIWGGMYVVVKVVVEYIPPVQLVWIRYLIAIIVLLLFSLLKKEKWQYNHRDLLLILLIGIIGNVVSILFQETGTWLSDAQTGAVITSSTPTFMLLFAWKLLKEKLTKVKIFSVALATVGVIAIVGINLKGQHIILGVLSLIIAALTWALMSVLIKMLSGTYSSLQVTILATLFAVIILTPFSLAQPKVFQNVNFFSPTIVFPLLYLGIISTAVAFIMWNYGLKLTNTSTSGLFFLLQPIVGTLLGLVFLNEKITWGFVVGTLLILVSVWLSLSTNNE